MTIHMGAKMLGTRKEIPVAIVDVEAPEPARREKGEYQVYSTDEQRRGAGWIGSPNASVISCASP